MNCITLSTFGRLVPEEHLECAEYIAGQDFLDYSHDEVVLREFKRYLLLRRIVNRPITMQCRRVDEVWHKFILDTKKYRSFCESVYGYYLDHVSSHFALDPEFPGIYQEVFGEPMPGIWSEDRFRDDGNCA